MGAESPKNLLSPPLRSASGEELFEELAAGVGVRIERIVSHGHASPEGFWYDQETEEWVLLVRGQAELEIADPPRVVELGPGDFLTLPAGCRHRVLRTAADEPTVWLAVHYAPRRAGEAP